MDAANKLVWMAKEQGLALTGLVGLLKQFTKTVIQTALNEEMTERLDYEERDPTDRGSGNIRNGTRWKAVLTDSVGSIEIEGFQSAVGNV